MNVSESEFGCKVSLLESSGAAPHHQKVMNYFFRPIQTRGGVEAPASRQNLGQRIHRVDHKQLLSS